MTDKTYDELLDELDSYNQRTSTATDQYESNLTTIQEAVTRCETARDETVEISGSDNVEAVLAISSPGNISWDVDIPFNDGIKIDRGYGTFDTIDVSDAQDESVVIDLPTKSVDFSRASTAENVNKSGKSESLAIDAPAITKNGLSIYESLTNYILNNGDSSLWNEYNCTLSDTGDTGIDNTAMTIATVTGDNPLIHSSSGSTTALSEGDVISASIYAKAGTTDEIKFRFRDGSFLLSGTTVNLEGVVTVGDALDVISEYIGDGIYKLTVSYTLTMDVTDPYVTFYVASGGSVTDITGETIQVQYPQVILGYKGTSPTIITGATAVTRAADVASIPLENNMPVADQPFTIFVDCAIPDNGTTNSVFGISPSTGDATVTVAMMLRRIDNGDIQFYFDDADNTDKNVRAAGIDTDKHRYVCTYDGNTTTKLYIDGTLIDTNDTHGSKSYDDFTTIFLGRWYYSSSYINSEIENFRIYHGALTDNQIKSLGGPQ